MLNKLFSSKPNSLKHSRILMPTVNSYSMSVRHNRMQSSTCSNTCHGSVRAERFTATTRELIGNFEMVRLKLKELDGEGLSDDGPLNEKWATHQKASFERDRTVTSQVVCLAPNG